MREIVWLDSAVNDIQRLREFIAQENPAAAQRAATAIKESVLRLQVRPTSSATNSSQSSLFLIS